VEIVSVAANTLSMCAALFVSSQSLPLTLQRLFALHVVASVIAAQVADAAK
jgi:hypothetical protein